MMEFNVTAEGARPQQEPVFHFCFFGNFSGRGEPREDFANLEVTRSTFPQLMERLKPSVSLHLELPNIDDARQELSFSDLKDFSERGLRRSLPILGDLKALREAIATSHEDKPLDVNDFRAKHRALSQVAELAAANSGGGKSETIDLLNMIDIGEEDDGLQLPRLHDFFSTANYGGRKRAALLKEVDQVTGLLSDQILGHAELNRLHGLWRGLRTCLGLLPPSVRVTAVDAAKADLCDATWNLFVQPEGNPPPLDLAVYLEPLAHREDDCHILYHLGRMAAAMAVPMLLETDLDLFAVRAWRLLGHAKQVGRTFSGPNHLKWRKLRDEPGSEWLFPCANPVRFKPAGDQDDEDEGVLLPAVLVAAALLAKPLGDEGAWPSELLWPDATVELGEESAAKLSDQLADDMAYWGLCPVTTAAGEGQRLLGMNAFARVTQRGNETFSAANLVPYTLSYRFYAGCCGRYLRETRGDLEAFRRYAALHGEQSLETQTEDGQTILRIKPGFTIFRVRPDFVVGTN